MGRKGNIGTISHVEDSHGVGGRLMGHKDVLVWGRASRVVVGLGVVIFWFLLGVVIGDSRGRRARIVLGSLLLCSDLFCSEKATAWPSGATHGMFVAGLVKIRLWREGETGSEEKRRGALCVGARGGGPLLGEYERRGA